MQKSFFDKNMSFYLTAAFINAFVDLGHKITIQNIIFKTMNGTELLIMTQIVNALILLPFVLFFIPAGELSDKNSKLSNMRMLAFSAIFLCTALTLFYALGLFWAAFLATLALGTQAAFYSPAKFGYAKELAKNGNLAKTNSALQSISIVAIILSTLIFSIIFEALSLNTTGNKELYLKAMAPIGVILTILSIVEYLSLRQMAQIEAPAPITDISKINKYKTILSNKSIFVSMVILSIFFALSQSVMAAFPSFAKENLKITSALAVQAAMAASALGVIVGSLLAGNHKNSRHRIAYVFFGMFGYFLFLLFALNGEIYFSFFGIGIAAGFIIVPLNTLIQGLTKKELLGSAISISNLMQNILMLLFLGLGVLSTTIGFDAKNILLICSFIALLTAAYSLLYFPQPIIEACLAFLFGIKYSFRQIGKIPDSNTGKILIGNHTSFIDWAFLQIAMSEKIHFLMEKEIYEKPLFMPFLKFFGALPIDSKNAKESVKKAIRLLQDGKTIVIFPEGELTKDGRTGEFRKGFELIAKKSGADVFTFYLSGLFGSRFSKAAKKSYGIRKVCLVFGNKLEKIDAASAREAVAALRFKI